MLTLTTEVKQESQKLSNAPILLIYFTNLGLRYATKEYTWDTGAGTETFTERLSRKTSPSFTESTSELVNTLAAGTRMNIRILDWQGTTRNELFSTSADISDEPVEVWLKYDTTSNLKSDAVKIFEGKVVTYQFARDVLTINIKGKLPELDNDVLQESAIYEGKFEPIQYGDFAWGGDEFLMFPKDITPHFAQCRLVSTDEAKGTATYIISGHVMNQLPATNSIIGNVFYVRDKHWVKLAPAGASTDSYFTTGTKNYLTVKLSNATPTASGSLPKIPTEEDTVNNEATNWQNAVDGRSSTSVDIMVDDIPAKLAVKNPKFSTLKDVAQTTFYGTSAYFMAVVKFGAIDANAFQIRITDGTNTVTYTIDTTMANSYKTFYFPDQIQTFEDADNTSIIIEWDGLNGSIGDMCNVQGITVMASVQAPDFSEEFLYVRCIGKEFDSDWGGRKTVGNAISTISEVVEDLLRSAGYTSINTASFDRVHNSAVALGMYSAFSIVDQTQLKNLLSDIAQKMHIAIQYTVGGWRLVHSWGSELLFSTYGTDNPHNEDIYTDNPPVSGDSFTQHPLLKPKFSRTKVAKDKFTVHYVFTHDGYIYKKSVGTGSNEQEIENPYLKDESSATAFANEVSKLYLNQRMRVTFETFWNAVGLQIGDVINVRSVELSDSLLSATVNSQKWQVVDINRKWRPHKITIKAIEVVQ